MKKVTLMQKVVTSPEKPSNMFPNEAAVFLSKKENIIEDKKLICVFLGYMNVIGYKVYDLPTPADILRDALRHNSVSFFLVHNCDIEWEKRLRELSFKANLPMTDSYRMKEDGTMETLSEVL